MSFVVVKFGSHDGDGNRADGFPDVNNVDKTLDIVWKSVGVSRARQSVGGDLIFE